MGELRAAAVTEVHVIVPEGIDDPARPSGGNTYDRRVCDGLAALGWTVHEHAVDGAAALARALARIPDGAVVLLDGLIASPAPEALVPEARPAPAGRAPAHAARRPRASARCSRRPPRVVTTSEWTRRRLGELYGCRRGARGRARRRRRRPRAGHRGRRRAALRRGGDARQGARRAARRARDGGRSALALHVRGQPGPRPGVRRRRAAPRGASRRPGALRRAAHRRGARPRVRRRRPARARLARGDLRHGRHRGPGPRRCRCSPPTSAA